MRQFTLAFVSAFVLATAFVATAAADSHTAPAAGATTGATAGATTVTAVPQTGVGSIAMFATDGMVLMLIALAALMAFASIQQWRRA